VNIHPLAGNALFQPPGFLAAVRSTRFAFDPTFAQDARRMIVQLHHDDPLGHRVRWGAQVALQMSITHGDFADDFADDLSQMLTILLTICPFHSCTLLHTYYHFSPS
jgi:hypothetical protein